MTESHQGQLCWAELATANPKAAKDFYGKLFGWEFTDHSHGDMTYTMVKHKGKEFGGIWTIPKNQEAHIPPHWLNYILVDNIEKSLEQAQKLGATVVKPIAAAGDMGLFAVITDPTGAHIAIWETKK